MSPNGVMEKLSTEQQERNGISKENVVPFEKIPKLDTVIGGKNNTTDSNHPITTDKPIISPSDSVSRIFPMQGEDEQLDSMPSSSALGTQTTTAPSQIIPPPVPLPLNIRNRVVSLDRNQYIRNSSEEENEDSSSSSDDGSYFSDLGNLPSPKSEARPRLGSWSSAPNHPNGLPPVTATYSRRTSAPIELTKASKTRLAHDSDLSLSSDSEDENDDDESIRKTEKLSHPQPLMRTYSAPLPSKMLNMRIRQSSELDLSHVSSEVPPAAVDLQVIDRLLLNKPEHAHRLLSSSSLVSSSSEDASAEFGNRRTEELFRPKHRRQVGSFSGTSEVNAQEAHVLANSCVVDSELSDDDFMKDRKARKRRSPRFSKKQMEVTLSHTGASPGRPKAQISSLNPEQISAWQHGYSSHVTDSYMSSSQGYSSSERKEDHLNRNTSAAKLLSTNRFSYSEDDTTEESVTYNEMIRKAALKGERETNDLSISVASATDRSLDTRSQNEVLQKKSSSKGYFIDRASQNSSTTYASHTREIGDSSFYTSPPTYYKVYWQRWLMLTYISLLNFLSDWTCFSVAPIAVITAEAFGNINPEQLVMVFLASNTLATALEPTVLSRLGLRRTIVFGSFLLMVGSIIKSGGIPGIIGTELNADDAHWRIFLGFSLVGISQPLYQCTPALLSNSWFPEKERTFATGVALSSNQLGIGAAFLFGAIGVNSSDDIPSYFGFLTILTTLVFIGCFFQFQDAPPSPPSDTARVIRGSLEVKIPHMSSMLNIFPSGMNFGGSVDSNSMHNRKSSGSQGGYDNSESSARRHNERSRKSKSHDLHERDSPSNAFKLSSLGARATQKAKRASREGGSRRLRSSSSKSSRRDNDVWNGHNPSLSGTRKTTKDVKSLIHKMETEVSNYGSVAPSPMVEGMVGHRRGTNESSRYLDSVEREQFNEVEWSRTPGGERYDISADTPFANLRGYPIPGSSQPNYRLLHPHYMPYEYHDVPPPWMIPNSYVDPRLIYHHGPQYPGTYPPGYHHPPFYADPHGSHSVHRNTFARFAHHLPSTNEIDEGAEPVISQTGKYLDIEVRDDQILRSIRACFSRKGFTHTVVAFGASGIVLNTLSTYMDYLVRLGEEDYSPTLLGWIGALFQIFIMLSSVFIGKFTDRTRSYFRVVIVLLVLGAFALAECNINLDASRGSGLKWSLLIAAILIGPLQPIATEMAVELSFPLCSNTVLVIQQLVCNLASAIFIPIFQQVRNFGNDDEQRPEYTFSFYLLIVIHAAATVYFASFSGTYMRLAHERQKKDESIHRKSIDYDEERASLL